jgi:hypothetical protein
MAWKKKQLATRGAVAVAARTLVALVVLVALAAVLPV